MLRLEDRFMGDLRSFQGYQERTSYQEMGLHKPEPFRHEVEGYIPVPMAELTEARYR
jgi:hypothetical protein